MTDEEKKSGDSEKDLKAQFERDLDVAKKFMDPIHQRMDQDYEMYRNRWKQQSEFRVSKFFAYVETVVPFMVNGRVRGTTKAEFPEYVKHAEGMGYILDHTFDVNNWDYNAQRIAKMAEIYRFSLAYTGYDPDANNGTGKLCITEVNPRWCYVDPAVTELQDSSFFIYVEPMRVTKAVKLHPDKATEIKQSINKRKDAPADRSGGNKRNWFQTWFQSVKNFLNFDGNNGARDYSDGYTVMDELSEDQKRRESVAYVHYWYRDDEDKWRVSYWADEVFLEDEENPFWHGKLPYVPYVPTEDILSAVGLPVGEQIENINWEFNVLMNEIIRNVKLSNDPPVIRNSSIFSMTGDNRELVERRGGRDVISVPNPDMVPLNSIIDYLIPPQTQGAALELKQVLDQVEDQLLGTNDTMRGMGEATSGKEVQLKQEAAYTRIKTKLDNFEKFVKELSEMIIVNAMQFLDTTRPFRVKGDYRQYEGINQDESPFEVKPIPRGMDDQGQPMYDKKEFFLYANPNEWTKLAEAQPEQTMEGIPEQPVSEERTEEAVKEAYRILQFTVEIEAGSSLPTSRMARREEAMELFQAQLVDQQYVLDVYEVPGADEIMRRMAEAAQAQQEAQMQMEQAKMEQTMQMKQMELQARAQEQQMNNDAKLQQTQMNNDAKAQQAQAGQQPPDIATMLDELRAKDPRLQQLSDEEIMAMLAQPA
ncbi:hypothetical protein MO973_19585 [Paenibacillus sp. TRM 82003]|nr:hypothetical protein [Paenibacillus sp. TRM 82003]